MPASLTSASVSPRSIRSAKRAAFSSSVCSSKRSRGPVDAEVREQLARVARVLAEDEVRRLERLDRARRHVGEVAERRADDEELAVMDAGLRVSCRDAR